MKKETTFNKIRDLRVYIGSIDEKSAFVYTCFLGFDETLILFENFSLIGDVTITGEGLHILTYARHSSPLSSESSLACHTYCDTGHPFIIIITRETISLLKIQGFLPYWQYFSNLDYSSSNPRKTGF